MRDYRAVSDKRALSFVNRSDIHDYSTLFVKRMRSLYDRISRLTDKIGKSLGIPDPPFF